MTRLGDPRVDSPSKSFGLIIFYNLMRSHTVQDGQAPAEAGGY